MQPLVVSATRAEAAYVPDGVPLVITGIGKTAAAVAVTEALMGYSPAERASLTVINVGTAGALHDHLEGLHEIGRVLNHDLSSEALRALGVDPHEWIDIDPQHPARLATGDVFVTDPEVRARLAEQADLVDMEGYAVAFACQRLGVPVRLIKHVSDKADAEAMSWPDVVDASARVLANWLEAQL